MEINGKSIASSLENILKKEVSKLGKKRKIKLVTFLIGSSSDQLSFVKIKEKTAHRLGIDFELVHYKNRAPFFQEFMQKIKEKTSDPSVTGVIIQQPLPAALLTESLYDYIPHPKEVEGHRKKSPFLPPIGLAVLTILKYIYSPTKNAKNLLIEWNKDKRLFRSITKSKRVVLIGRGATGGAPIGKTLSDANINFININSKTPEPATYIREADIVITAVGKKIVNPTDLKPGVVLINVGLRREKGELKGDYNEKEIKTVSSAYTPTPGGVGPIDVLYLYKNLIEGYKLQK